MIFLDIQTAISHLDDPEIKDHIMTFHNLDCYKAKRIVAGKIIDLAIAHCANSNFTLDQTPTFILQYHFDNEKIDLCFQDQNIHFSLKTKVIIFPDQILSLHFQFVTNT